MKLKLKLGAVLLPLLFLAVKAALGGGLIPPPAQTQFFTSAGAPVVGGRVYFYVPNTTTPSPTWSNPALSVLNPNPVILDPAGRASIWAPANTSFREVVQDQFGNLVWDQPTATGSTSGLSGPVVSAVNGTVCWGNTTGTALISCPSSAISVNTISAAYSVAPSDCGGIIDATGGSSAINPYGLQYSITFGTAGIAAGCSVMVIDEDSRSKSLTGVSTGVPQYLVWPNQVITATYDGIAWSSNGPQRYLIQSPVVYVGSVPGTTLGQCSDSNDGLSNQAPMCTASAAVSLLQSYFACGTTSGGYNNTAATVNLLAGVYSSFNLQIYGPPPPGCGNQIMITGAGHAQVTLNCAGKCVDAQNGAGAEVSGFTFNCGSAPGITARETARLQIADATEASCTGQNVVEADAGGFISIATTPSGIVINGKANDVFSAQGAGSTIYAPSGSVSVNSSPVTFAYFADAIQLGELVFGPTQVVGGGAVTGVEWFADLNGAISTSGSGTSCNAFFGNVGNQNGVASNGGQCE